MSQSNPEKDAELLRVNRVSVDVPGINLPPGVKIVVLREEDETISRQPELSPAKDVPFLLMLPRFPAPTLLSDRSWPEGETIFVICVNQDVKSKIQSLGPGALILQKFGPLPFCRMLAKIAHGAAIAYLGEDAFEPLLLDLILGETKEFSKVIGTSLKRPFERPYPNEIYLTMKAGYLLAEVRIFADHRFRPYEVVVGRPLPSLASWHLYSTITRSAQAT
jgi:hypothetical protein